MKYNNNNKDCYLDCSPYVIHLRQGFTFAHLAKTLKSFEAYTVKSAADQLKSSQESSQEKNYGFSSAERCSYSVGEGQC